MKELRWFGAIVFLLCGSAIGQVYPPGTFVLAGQHVSCGPTVVVLNPSLNDSGMADGRGHIILNPGWFAGKPGVLQLWMYGHECGHYNVGANETQADCWSIRTGKRQGWFSAGDFGDLVEMFKNNPGDSTHLPGPQRVQAMISCYNASPGPQYQRGAAPSRSDDTETDSTTGDVSGDPLCEAIEDLLKGGRIDFSRFKGESEYGLGEQGDRFKSNKVLPGASECIVSNNSLWFSCQLRGKPEAEFERVIGGCLADDGWTRTNTSYLMLRKSGYGLAVVKEHELRITIFPK